MISKKRGSRDTITLGKRLFDMLDFFLSQRDRWVPQEEILLIFYEDESNSSIKKFERDRERLATLFGLETLFEHDGKRPRSWRSVRGCNFDVAKIEDKQELLTLVAGLEMAKKFIPEQRQNLESMQKYFYGAINKTQEIQAQNILHGIGWNVPVAEKIESEFALPHCYTMVLEALQEKTPLRIDYISPEYGALNTTIVPWELYFQYHDWYLRAADLKNRRARIFRLTRIQRIEHFNMGYEIYVSIPPHVVSSFQRGGNDIPLDPATAALENKSITVRLNIFGRFADAVYRVTWFPHERKTWIHPPLETDSEVGPVLLYEVELDSLWWISKWVLRGADSIQILEPPELKSMVFRAAETFLCRNSSIIEG
nr:WYL domain-containing protein [uncultured Dethiosulfovibrio sp.]